MPQGLQVWDASGELTVTITDSLPIFLGFIDTGTQPGSANIPLLGNGTPFFCVRHNTTGQAVYFGPNVSMSGNTISWTFSSQNTRYSARIQYGTF